MKKKYVKRISVVVFVVLLLFSILCMVHSFQYPRIARSAYWRRPMLLAKATLRCAVPGKGVPKRDVLEDAQAKIEDVSFNAKLLYLPHEPENDSTIQSRVFVTTAQGCLDTQETLFWVVVPKKGSHDNTLIYEYKTGRLVCGEIILSSGFINE